MADRSSEVNAETAGAPGVVLTDECGRPYVGRLLNHRAEMAATPTEETPVDLRLTGKNVVVTGASKGIGFAIAKAFSKEGANLVLASRRGPTLEAAGEAIRNAVPGASVTTHVADLADQAAREELARSHGDADILVNNAGAIPRGTLEELSFDDWRRGWELKVLGYVHLTKLFLEAMRPRRDGVILNVIGTAGRSPRADYICGATGNASLIAFTEAVGGQSLDDGVRVLGINPGYTATERFLGRSVGIDGPDRELLRQEFPASRIALPTDVADLAVLLCSDRSRSVSGVVVDCDLGNLRSGPTRPTPLPLDPLHNAPDRA